MVADERTSSCLRVHCQAMKSLGLAQAYGQRQPGELTALVGSSGYLEIAVVNGSAAEKLKAETGNAVTLEW